MRSASRRRASLLALALVVACAATVAQDTAPRAPQPASARRPNILLLFTDQLRGSALGYAGDPFARTPSIDRLAASGFSFSRAYCQNPVCLQSRFALMTGRYTHASGEVLPRGDVPRDQVTFNQVLREHGYVTACFGKLHVRGRDDLDWDLVNPREWPSLRQRPVSGGLHGRRPLGSPLTYPEEFHPDWRATEETLDFLANAGEQPWFVQCSLTVPHPPFQPPERHWKAVDRSALVIPEYPENDLEDVDPTYWSLMVERELDDLTDEQILDAMQGYYGNIAYADELFGKVLARLDELGLRENTIVVLVSDHGEMLYEHRLWTKFNFFEQSVRVPLVISWPGKLESGVASSAMVELIDLFPTLMDLAGLPTPSSAQGMSLAPLLRGKTQTHRHVVHCERGAATGMIFDGRYKLIRNPPGVEPELYDLESDPREITNLARVPAQRARVQRMLAAIAEWKGEERR